MKDEWDSSDGYENVEDAIALCKTSSKVGEYELSSPRGPPPITRKPSKSAKDAKTSRTHSPVSSRMHAEREGEVTTLWHVCNNSTKAELFVKGYEPSNV